MIMMKTTIAAATPAATPAATVADDEPLPPKKWKWDKIYYTPKLSQWWRVVPFPDPTLQKREGFGDKRVF